GAAVRDARLLDRRVRVEEVLAVRLVHAAVEVAAEVGQHHDLEVLVLQVQRAPARDGAAVGEVLAQRVRVVEAPRLERIERRVHVGQALFVRGQVEVVLPDADRRGWRGGRCGDCGRRTSLRPRGGRGGETRGEGEEGRPAESHGGLIAIL